jgi:uncharacterized protein YlxW (UPF0749 family)
MSSLANLTASFSQPDCLQERQVAQLSVEKRQLEEENTNLKEKVKDLTALMVSIQVTRYLQYS